MDAIILKAPSDSVMNGKNINTLAMNENSEANLIVSYLPSFTSASQPIRGARSFETNIEYIAKTEGML